MTISEEIEWQYMHLSDEEIIACKKAQNHSLLEFDKGRGK